MSRLVFALSFCRVPYDELKNALSTVLSHIKVLIYKQTMQLRVGSITMRQYATSMLSVIYRRCHVNMPLAKFRCITIWCDTPRNLLVKRLANVWSNDSRIRSVSDVNSQWVFQCIILFYPWYWRIKSWPWLLHLTLFFSSVGFEIESHWHWPTCWLKNNTVFPSLFRNKLGLLTKII